MYHNNSKKHINYGGDLMIIKTNNITILFILSFIVLIIAFPNISNCGVTEGLLLSANVVIPALFPFMICVLMFMKINTQFDNKFINKILYRLFGQNFDLFLVFVLSMIGGYPAGAGLINEMYNQNLISKKAANILLSYCVNAGPAFVILVVGGAFSSQDIGIVLLISHLFSSIIISLVCAKSLKKEVIFSKHNEKRINSFSQIFVDSVVSASKSMINVCSFIIFFSVVNEYIDYFFSNIPIIKNISYITEVTQSVRECKNIYFISFLLGFSGLCIWFQVFALCENIEINLLRFVSSRIIHGTISMILTYLQINIFNIKIVTFSNKIEYTGKLFYSNVALFLSLLIMILLFCIFIISKNNSGKFINDVL